MKDNGRKPLEVVEASHTRWSRGRSLEGSAPVGERGPTDDAVVLVGLNAREAL